MYGVLRLNRYILMNCLALDDKTRRMPLSVQRSVRKQNIKFLHNRILFSPEYFLFIRRLVHSNVQQLVLLIQQQQQQQEEKESLTNVIDSSMKIAKQVLLNFRPLKN